MIDTGCSWTFVIQPTVEEIEETLSPGTKRQILRHNRRYETHCESGESQPGEGSEQASG